MWIHVEGPERVLEHYLIACAGRKIAAQLSPAPVQRRVAMALEGEPFPPWAHSSGSVSRR
jgi:hypothetical protein